MMSSSPSHLHLTLWKAVAEKKDFRKYYAVMMSLPFDYGFSNKRWEQAIDCMLEKAGNKEDPPYANNWTPRGRLQHSTQ
ncbi:hypothetical protein ACHAWF_000629, partial [Thalassiosira exigua]